MRLEFACKVACRTTYGTRSDGPADDPALAALFPGGVTYNADPDVDNQPARMDLLAELLELRIHPRLSPQQVKGHAKDIRAAVKGLWDAVDAIAVPNDRMEMLQRVRRTPEPVNDNETALVRV